MKMPENMTCWPPFSRQRNKASAILAASAMAYLRGRYNGGAFTKTVIDANYVRHYRRSFVTFDFAGLSSNLAYITSVLVGYIGTDLLVRLSNASLLKKPEKMVEINNQRKAFLDMLAWSEWTDNGTSENQKSWLWRHCRRRAIYWLLRSPSQTCHAKPKTQINRRRTLPASFPLVGCLPQAAWPERLLSEKSGRCGIAADCERGAYLWLIVVISVRQSTVAAISGLHCRALVMVSSSIRLTAWLQNSKKRAERSERLMYEQSHRDYLRSGYLHHRLLPVMGC